MDASWGASCGTLFAKFTVAFTLLALGCAKADTSLAQPDSQAQGNGQIIPEVRSTEQIKIGGAGTTVKLELDAKFRAKFLPALDKKSRQAIRLTIRNLERPDPADDQTAAVIGISIYIDKPDATSATPAEDSHHVGSAIFSEGKDERTQSFLFDMRPALLRLAELDKLPPLDQPLQVTIVPYLADGTKAAPEKLSMPVKSISISLPRPRGG